MEALSPVENFSHQTILFTAIELAHVVRCLANAGLLDQNAKMSFNVQFKILHEAATKTGSRDCEEWIDMLVRALPPMPLR